MIPGQTHMIKDREGKQPVISKTGAARSGFFGRDTKEE